MSEKLCSATASTGHRCAKPDGHEGNHRPRAEHHCHAVGCGIPCPPERLMCPRHWRMVPKEIQRRVWANYRDGQCDDKKPSRDWMDAASDAIRVVAEKDDTLTRKHDARQLRLMLSPNQDSSHKS